MSGGLVEFDWRGRRATAWSPEQLRHRSFAFSETTVRAAEGAVAALRLLERRFPARWEPLGRLLLRAEGIASSSIEGLRMPIVDVAFAEATDDADEAGWIVANLDAFVQALGTEPDLSVEHLHQWHRTLMEKSPLASEMVGAFRTSPSWIGGTSPLDAAYVPPPAHLVPELIDDLIEYANSDRHDAVTQASIVHAQFETIHPYGDGNGRLGRILIGWVLRRRGVIERLPPPVSVLIARDAGGYIGGLYFYREGADDNWTAWFARVMSAAATWSEETLADVESLQQQWMQRLGPVRRDAAAARLVEHLPAHPVVNANEVAAILGISTRSARTALSLLVDRGILETIGGPTSVRGRPSTWYAATELLDLGRSWGS